jgi:hypothetical protein
MSVRVPQREASWVLSLFPDAGEAGGCFVSTLRRGGSVFAGSLPIRKGRVARSSASFTIGDLLSVAPR